MINNNQFPTINTSVEDYFSTPKYRTKTVAMRLNISEQALRNFLLILDDSFPVYRTGQGHRLFSLEDIIHLRLLLSLKNEKGFSATQLKAVLKESLPELLPLDDLEYLSYYLYSFQKSQQVQLDKQLALLTDLNRKVDILLSSKSSALSSPAPKENIRVEKKSPWYKLFRT